MVKQKPLIMESPITGEFYYVDKYTDLGDGKFVADNKRKATKQEIKEYKEAIRNFS